MNVLLMYGTAEEREKRQHAKYNSERQRLHVKTDSDIDAQYFHLLAKNKTNKVSLLFLGTLLVISFAIAWLNLTHFDSQVFGRIKNVSPYELIRVIVYIKSMIATFTTVIILLLFGFCLQESRRLNWHLLIFQDEKIKRNHTHSNKNQKPL